MKGDSMKCKCACTSRLSVLGLSFALGLLSAISMAAFAWAALWSGHGNVIIAQWAEFFPGFAATIKGGWIGAGWGFVEGFVSGFILSVIYNLFLCCCKACCGCCKEDVKTKK